MRILFGCLISLGLAIPVTAFAVNPPQWNEFHKGESLDSANVKFDGTIAAAYVMEVGANGKVTTLYEVNCKEDQIRVHSDTPRFVRIPVSGGGTVVQSDDGFRTVIPGSRNARIESAICETAEKEQAEAARQEEDTRCKQALTDDSRRIDFASLKLDYNEMACLDEIARGKKRTSECSSAGIPEGTTVTQYLHGKGIYLECEDRPAMR